jgi:hypothetical protein
MSGYPLDRLYEEVAYLATRASWSHEAVLTMPHWERRRWCAEVRQLGEGGR